MWSVRVVVALSIAVTAVSSTGCGYGDDEDDNETQTPPPAQAVPPTPEPNRDTGAIAVAEFNRFLEETSPSFATDALGTAEEFVHVGEGQAARTSVVETEGPEGGGDEASVQVTRDGLADDSVRAVRYEVLLERAGDGTWRLRSAKRLQRCHLNRGHQDFSPQLCT
jgi:hypothetical protein